MRYGWMAKFAIGGVAGLLLAGAQNAQDIPKAGDGYQITRKDTSEKAPEEYMGQTDTATLTAVGNTAATLGKTIVAHFTMSNKVRRCPQADGTVEGEGLMEITTDSTIVDASGTKTGHLQMRVTGKYTGKVGDDAFIHDPVNADLTYNYIVSGTFAMRDGSVTTPPESNVAQQITIPIIVMGKGMQVPSFGPFTGGDPTNGNLGSAYGAGMALAFWGGVYYSMAETFWTRDPPVCAWIQFTPPSKSMKLVPGGSADITAVVKSIRGGTAKAQIGATPGKSGGSVTPGGGPSEAGKPIKFTFTAPAQAGKAGGDVGFHVDAGSTAGAASAYWDTGLGTGWSGQLSCSRVLSEGPVGNEWQKIYNFSSTQITVQVTNGEATALGYAEEKHSARAMQPALRGGVKTAIFYSSDDSEGSVRDGGKGTVDVDIDKAGGMYSISESYGFTQQGEINGTSCMRDQCRPIHQKISVESCFEGVMAGKLGDANHVQGNWSDVKTNTGSTNKGLLTRTVSWNLSRQGTTK